jgi:hypothetical protein
MVKRPFKSWGRNNKNLTPTSLIGIRIYTLTRPWFTNASAAVSERLDPLRRRHEAFIHPLAQIRAEPFRRKFPSQSLFFACFVNQSAGSRELDAHAGVALV